MKHLIATVTVLSVFFCSNTFASLKWTEYKKVTSVQVVENGSFLIEFESEVAPECSTAGTSTIYMYKDKSGLTQEGVKAMLSVALMALATNMSVSALYDESTKPACWGQYIKIKK